MFSSKVTFNFQIFGDFLGIVPVLISNLIPLWSENILWQIPVHLSLLRLVV